MSRSQFAVYQLKKKPELRNLLFRTYEELAQDQIPVQVKNYEQVYLGTMKPGETYEPFCSTCVPSTSRNASCSR